VYGHTNAWPQDAAKASLELHGQELEPGLQMNVFLSNPERKKGRTDADADEKEVYVAGLSKFTKQAELVKLFRTVRIMTDPPLRPLTHWHMQYGRVKEVRMETDEEGNSKGFAFVEFEEAVRVRRLLPLARLTRAQSAAAASLNANNHQLHNRRMAVTIADARRRKK
jgi:RNA recognition motif-containing protein